MGDKKKKRVVKDENYYTTFGWMTNPDGMNLRGTELKLYAIIYGFSQTQENYFTGSLQYLAEWTNSTERNVINNLNSLVEKGFLRKKQIAYNKYHYQAVVKKFHHTDLDGEKISSDGEKISSSDGEKISPDGEKISPNNIDILKGNISSDRREKKATPIKQKYGKYENVKLTRDEVVELNDKFGFQTIKEYIKKLDEYIETSGKKYNNHALVISNWINEDKDKNKSSGSKKTQFNNFSQRQDTDFNALEKKMTGGT